MKKIITLIIVASLVLAGAGCNEEKPTTAAVAAPETPKDINLNGPGQSTAIPTLDMPEKGKYKY